MKMKMKMNDKFPSTVPQEPLLWSMNWPIHYSRLKKEFPLLRSHTWIWREREREREILGYSEQATNPSSPTIENMIRGETFIESKPGSLKILKT